MKKKCVETIFYKYNIDAFIIKDLSNFFWFTGQKVTNWWLIFKKDFKYILTDSRYIERFKNFEDWKVFNIADLKLWILNFLKEELNVYRIGIEWKSWNVLEYEKLVEVFSEDNIVLLKDDVERCRAIKSLDEINKIKEAIKIINLVYDDLEKNFKNYVWFSEIDIRREIIYKIFQYGGEGESFESIVAFWKNTSIPHWQSSRNNLLRENMPVLIDMGAIYQGYCSDFTRSFWFWNKIDKLWQKIYDLVRKAHDEVWKIAKPWIKISDLDKKAREILAEWGFEKYFTHALGHWIGIDVHEYPIISWKNEDILKPWMVFTIEPGVYLPWKFGVRRENIKIIS